MQKINKDKFELGTIELGTEVYATDPCYSIGTWCQVLVQGLKPGKYHCFMYKAYVNDWNGKSRVVTDLWIAHEDNIKAYPKKLLNDYGVGVDTGVAGFFDKDYYEFHQIHETEEQDDEDEHVQEWRFNMFDQIYEYALNGEKYIEPSWDVFTQKWVYPKVKQERLSGKCFDNKCVNCLSGFGDGSYSLYEAKNSKGQIVALRLKFI